MPYIPPPRPPPIPKPPPIPRPPPGPSIHMQQQQRFQQQQRMQQQQRSHQQQLHQQQQRVHQIQQDNIRRHNQQIQSDNMRRQQQQQQFFRQQQQQQFQRQQEQFRRQQQEQHQRQQQMLHQNQQTHSARQNQQQQAFMKSFQNTSNLGGNTVVHVGPGITFEMTTSGDVDASQIFQEFFSDGLQQEANGGGAGPSPGGAQGGETQAQSPPPPSAPPSQVPPTNGGPIPPSPSHPQQQPPPSGPPPPYFTTAPSPGAQPQPQLSEGVKVPLTNQPVYPGPGPTATPLSPGPTTPILPPPGPQYPPQPYPVAPQATPQATSHPLPPLKQPLVPQTHPQPPNQQQHNVQQNLHVQRPPSQASSTHSHSHETDNRVVLKDGTQIVIQQEDEILFIGPTGIQMVVNCLPLYDPPEDTPGPPASSSKNDAAVVQAKKTRGASYIPTKDKPQRSHILRAKSESSINSTKVLAELEIEDEVFSKSDDETISSSKRKRHASTKYGAHYTVKIHDKPSKTSASSEKPRDTTSPSSSVGTLASPEDSTGVLSKSSAETEAVAPKPHEEEDDEMSKSMAAATETEESEASQKTGVKEEEDKLPNGSPQTEAVSSLEETDQVATTEGGGTTEASQSDTPEVKIESSSSSVEEGEAKQVQKSGTTAKQSHSPLRKTKSERRVSEGDDLSEDPDEQPHRQDVSINYVDDSANVQQLKRSSGSVSFLSRAALKGATISTTSPSPLVPATQPQNTQATDDVTDGQQQRTAASSETVRDSDTEEKGERERKEELTTTQAAAVVQESQQKESNPESQKDESESDPTTITKPPIQQETVALLTQSNGPPSVPPVATANGHTTSPPQASAAASPSPTPPSQASPPSQGSYSPSPLTASLLPSPPATVDPEYVERSGWLNKLSHRKGMFGDKWQKRYFVLHRSWLYYFKKYGDSNPRGVIRLLPTGWSKTISQGTRRMTDAVLKGNEQVSAIISVLRCFAVHRPDNFAASLSALLATDGVADAFRSQTVSVTNNQHASRTFYMIATSNEERDMWVEAINTNTKAYAHSAEALTTACKELKGMLHAVNSGVLPKDIPPLLLLLHTKMKRIVSEQHDVCTSLHIH